MGFVLLELTGIELTPTAVRPTMLRSCTIVIDVATQQPQVCLPRLLGAKWTRLCVHEARALKGSAVREEKYSR